MTKPKPKQVLVTWKDAKATSGHDAKATITPAGVKLAAKMARAGHPNYGIAAVMGLGKDSFRRAIDRQPELRQALDVALGELEAECVSALVTAMRKGAWAPACFLLKGKFGFREAGVVEQPTGQTQVNIIIPPRMTDEQYQEVIRNITPAPEAETKLIEGVVVTKRVIR